MKKRILSLFLVLSLMASLMVALPVSVSAEKGTKYGNYLYYEVSNDEVKITDCVVSATTIEIPVAIDGKPVTSIEGFAFSSCSNLTSITIPNSVTSIGYKAFSSCSSLTSIIIPSSVTSIGNYAFSYCSSLASFTIPSSVTSIGAAVFYECSSLASITIPSSVTSIGASAFYFCSSLTSITIPDSVTSIGVSAFYGCGYYNDKSNWENNGLYIGNHLIKAKNTDLGNYSIKPNTKTIADYAFSTCSSLTSITIPDSVTSIGEMAFSSCSSLTSVVIPSSVSEIEAKAFYDCPISLVFYTGTSEEWDEMYIGADNDTFSTAEFVPSAKKKTYKFVTNCESALPDITDCAVMTLPTVQSNGKTFLGWYDNAGLTGNPITFPYSGNATTLYAAWTDKTGTSFDDSIAAEANRQYTVSIADSGQIVYYEFTPKLTGEYRFYTKGNMDTQGYLYDSNKRQLTSNDGGGESNNFKIAYNLTAGEKYYIAMKCYSGVGTFTFVTEMDCFEGTKTTISDDEKAFNIKCENIANGSMVVLALYDNGKFVEMQSATYNGEDISFTTDKAYTNAKVMVWESLANMKPVCGVEIVK